MDLDSGRLVAVNVLTDSFAQPILGSSNHVGSFISKLVETIGMEALSKPQFFFIPSSPLLVDHPVEDDGGLTAQCVISTSHIAYHSWPLQNRFRVVVDSCKDFRPNDVFNVISACFPVKRYSVQNMSYTIPDRELAQEQEKT